MSYQSVTQAVQDKRDKLEKAVQNLRLAEQAVRDLETELRVWTEAEALLPKPMKETADPQKETSIGPVIRKTRKRTVRKRGGAKAKGTRAPKVNWRLTMDRIAFQNADFSLQDVEATAIILGIILKPAAVRSQMAQYVTSGLLDRVKNGIFRLTPFGHQTFKVSGLNEVPIEEEAIQPSNSSNGDRMLEQTVP